MTDINLVNWRNLWAEEPFEQTFLAWPLIPAQRLCALNGVAKVGKSLLALEAAACIATGRDFLGHPTVPGNVLYLDFENSPRTDVRPRLELMGFNPDELFRLKYLSYPNLPSFDTADSTNTLNKLLADFQPVLVVVDTISRIVDGEENSNDTWNKVFKHSETHLKQQGVSLLRLDHLGKTDSKGARGASAKSGTVDVSWKFTEAKSGDFVVTAEFQRMKLETTTFKLNRLESPYLHHSLVAKNKTAPDDRVEAALQLLEEKGYPANMTQEETGKLLRHEYGMSLNNTKVAQVCQKRKVLQNHIRQPKNSDTSFSPKSTQNGNYAEVAISDYPPIDEYEISDAEYEFYNPAD